MSFLCKCGKVKIRQVRIVTAIRKVTYFYKIKYNLIKLSKEFGVPVIAENRLKIVKTTEGTEIVSEDIHCKECAPAKIMPKVVENVIREKIVKIIDTTEEKFNKRGKNFRRGNQYGKFRKSNSSIK